MDLTIIAAISENNIIGREGKIPWNIPEDMKRFKQLTLNHPVIMGRKTYQSLPERFRPLPQRKNIVLSRSFESDANIYIARSIEEALNMTKENASYVIGGEEIYALFLPLANRMEITRVNRDYEGDSFFPEVNWDMWKLIREENHFDGEGRQTFQFLSYIK